MIWVFDRKWYVYGDEWVYVPHLAVRPVQTSDDEAMAEVDWEENAGKITGEYLHLYKAIGPVEWEPDELQKQETTRGGEKKKKEKTNIRHRKTNKIKYKMGEDDKTPEQLLKLPTQKK